VIPSEVIWLLTNSTRSGIKTTINVKTMTGLTDLFAIQINTRSKSWTQRINSFINRLEEVKILICKFAFHFYVKHDHLELSVNVKEFWILFVKCKKAKRFYDWVLQRGIGDPLVREKKPKFVQTDYFSSFKKANWYGLQLKHLYEETTRTDPRFFKGVAGSLGLQNQWGMHPKFCNLRTGT